MPGLPALLFLDTRQDAHEARDGSSSYYNDYEATLAARMVNKLVDKGCRPGQIGVIVPYRAQVRASNSLSLLVEKKRHSGNDDSKAPSCRGQTDLVLGFQSDQRERLFQSPVGKDYLCLLVPLKQPLFARLELKTSQPSYRPLIAGLQAELVAGGTSERHAAEEAPTEGCDRGRGSAQ